MPERKRSKDRTKETEQFRQPDAGANPGRSGGGLARDVGSEDELKRARKGDAGVSRVTKSEEKDTGEQENKDR